jgi:hypothetical protein
MRLFLLAASAFTVGCANKPQPTISPVDAEMTARVYDLTLAELRRLLTPKAQVPGVINWGERMYLNPTILLPAADSATPLLHDSAWMANAVARGDVVGICGKEPASPCPVDIPIAFTSLTPPWTLGTDTVYVQGGYAGEVPGERRYGGTFWVFTLGPDDEGVFRVLRKGPPNHVDFERQ